MNRRQALTTTLIAGPAALLANTPQGDRPRGAARPAKVTSVEVLSLEKPLKERFWMANAPIGGYEPRASRLIVRLHTDAGITGEGEGSGGAELFRKGFADLVIGQDPFMVGRIWEKMFAATYGREPSTRGWSQHGVISAMAPIDAALYDIMAKSTGLPLYKFLGGYRDSVPVYVTGGYYREGKGIPELVHEIRGYTDQGFNAIKLKVAASRPASPWMTTITASKLSANPSAERCASCSTLTTVGMSKPPSAPPTGCTTSTSPGSKSLCTGTTISSRSSR